jgi:3-dehydroquinate dehydratase/shikimate dehydrogenase
MVDKAEAVVRDNPLLEFRLDYLRQPGAALPRLRRFLELHPECLAIATCRRAKNGGRFRGSVAAQIDVLTKAASAGCQILDVELDSAQAMKFTEYQRLRGKGALLLSFHDFRGTRKLDQTFEKMRGFPADFYKVVTTATRLYDNVLMMKFLERQSHGHSVVGLCMGEQGVISRVLGLRAGSVFTFAAANPGEETAPGQIPFRTLRDVYRIEQVDAATRVYAVAGDPVSQSLSPQMMNAAFRRENVNGVYLALHAKTVDDLLACTRDIPISGLSITMPYKEEIVPHLDNSDSLTAKSGACNTVVRAADGRLYGFNTDVAGVILPLENRMPLGGARVLVLGAGGAARAAVFGLKERGAEVYILNRTPAPAQKLARQAKARTVKRANLKKLQFDVIINATPVGMGNGKDSLLNEKEIKARYLLEMVYSGGETRLAKLARLAGAEVIPGVEMFVHQGARQFEIWTGKPAPVDEMRHVVVTALESRAREKELANGRNGNRKK